MMMSLQRMNDSSKQKLSTFENLHLSSVSYFLDAIQRNEVRQRSHIRRLFLESATGFDEVVNFVMRLGLVVEQNGIFQLIVNWPLFDNAKRSKIILDKLFRARNRYRSEIYRFINQFSLIDGELTYNPSMQLRSKESGVRNFLIEAGVVKHVIDMNGYVLSPEFITIYASARDNSNSKTPITLEHELDRKNEIGLAAELLIVSYEKSRIGQSMENKVVHISHKNVSAGYDIRSATIEDDGSVSPRFIEVKAVPSKSYKFYWSRNEVNVARVLGHWYWLYLLPIDQHAHFDLERLRMLSNPCVSLLSDPDHWSYENDALVCYRKL